MDANTSPMNIITGGPYDALAQKFNTIALELMNEVLKEHGVSNKATREKICGSILFRVGDFIDSCWIEHDHLQYRPGLAFRDHQGLDIPAERLLLPHPEDAIPIHEVAHLEAGAFFGQRKEDASDIKTGPIYGT
jgi:hypothetical protein